MPLALAPILATGYQVASKAKLGTKVKQALWRGYGLIREGVTKAAKGAKFNISEKGLEGYSIAGITASQGENGSKVIDRSDVRDMTSNYVPYLIGGALLLMLLKK
jgi:hypothetical protein